MNSLIFVAAVLSAVLGIVFAQNCPNGWTHDEKSMSCLKAFNEKLNWNQAKKECVENGGDLAQPDSMATNMLMQSLLRKGQRYWIGIVDDDNNGHYHYMNGRDVAKFKRWAGGEPSNHGGNELCVEMIGNRRGSWNDKFCTKKRFYVCQNPIPQGVECAQDWFLTETEDSCVKAFEDKKGWNRARKICRDNGGDLVRVDNFEKNQFVRDLLTRGKRYWLGMTDSNKDRVFEYTDGALMREGSYEQWAYKEPNNKGGNEGCIEMIANGKGAWNDRRCTRKWGFVCEKKPDAKQ